MGKTKDVPAVYDFSIAGVGGIISTYGEPLLILLSIAVAGLRIIQMTRQIIKGDKK